MKRRILIVTLTAAVLFGSALQGVAAPPGGPDSGPCVAGPGGQEDPGRRFLEDMTRALTLTEAQQARIKALQAADREKNGALHAKRRENHQQLRRIEEAKTLDERALRSVAEQGGAIETELIIARAKMRHQIDAILTPEQRQLAARLRSEAGEKHKDNRR